MKHKILQILAGLIVLSGSIAAQAKCVPVYICDDKGKNCHHEDMCSVYKEESTLETRKLAAPPPQAPGEPIPLIAPKPACGDQPVPGQPRKICK